MLIDRVPVAPKVIPHLPERLSGLNRLAHNLRWAWDADLRAVFARLETPFPVGPVAAIFDATNLDALAKDDAYVAQVNAANAKLDGLMAAKGKLAGFGGTVAYFCAEFGIHESFPLYSGGLGILAGDHLKEASDQGLPFIAVGLFYRRGFFYQMIDREGRQEHEYPKVSPERHPVQRVLDTLGQPLTISIAFPGRTVHAAVWRASVGRVPLILLDTDLPENSPEDRPITSQLYTSGRDMRLHQEIVLGVGGVRALRALGIQPTTWHLNEGHSALLLLERLLAGESQAEVKASSVLTIHTPVAAGNERFDKGHALRTLSALLKGGPIKDADLAKLGLDSENDKTTFDLTAFALRLTRDANGVSLLHGTVADGTWRPVTKKEIIGVTNGVHMPTWLGPDLRGAFEARGAEFSPATSLKLTERKDLRATWDTSKISDADLWAAHQAQKVRMIEFTRKRLAGQFARHGAGPAELADLLSALAPEAFTIGFARRFATYKRAALLFSDERRLVKLLKATDKPIQILFAGKAHPADRDGQGMIAQIYEKTQSPKFKGKVFLLEEYDMATGAHLVQGVDLWLNNPRRPLEASGTSGMKAAANGVPNLSILDGWWDEAYEETPVQNGFAIGGRTTLKSVAAQDKADAKALYEQLEQVVLPAYFERDAQGLPTKWLPIMRASIATSVWAFSTARMLDDYVAEMYR